MSAKTVVSKKGVKRYWNSHLVPVSPPRTSNQKKSLLREAVNSDYMRCTPRRNISPGEKNLIQFLVRRRDSATLAFLSQESRRYERDDANNLLHVRTATTTAPFRAVVH